MVEEGNTCISCGEDVCLFIQFQADVANLRRWHERAEALATNRERRKHAFRAYFRWSHGDPSRAYMGFYGDEDQSLRRRAVDAEGNEIDLWWEFRDGAWELAEG